MKMKMPLAAFAATFAIATSAVAFQGTATIDLPLRSGPGPMHSIIGTIERQAPVEVEGCIENGNWCQVSYLGKRGWAHAANIGAQSQGRTVVVSEARSTMQVPVVRYTEQMASTAPATTSTTSTTTTSSTGSTGAATGAAGGVVAGALLGGPIGAVIGGLAGLAGGAVVDPPGEVKSYVTANRVDPVYLEGEVAVGSALPSSVTVYEVPKYEYRYATVNGQTVLVEPGTNKVVYVYR